MRLYDYGPPPSPRRVRIFIAEKGITLPMETIDLGKGEQYSERYRAINPRCTVPTLELDDGSYLSEGLAICDYLEALYPEPPLFGRTPQERAQVIMWFQRIEFEGFHAVAEVLRNSSRAFKDSSLTGPDRYPQLPELVERGRHRVAQFYASMHERLSQLDYVAGPFYSFADISLLCIVDFGTGWGRMPIPPELTALLAWHGRMSARPSAKA